MPRITRSSAAAARARTAREVTPDGADNVNATVRDPSDSEAGGSSGRPSIEVHLKHALHDAKALQSEIESLRKHNAAMKRRLEEIETAGEGGEKAYATRKRPSMTELLEQVRTLKADLKKLKKERKRDRRRIEKLKMKEINEDAANLKDAVFEVGDSAYHMRKLLRRFHDLMLSTSLEEKEECPVCMEGLEPEKCASLPCDHTFCNDCMARISKDLEIISCPHCRSEFKREEIETVKYTASQQWDELLEVAKAWAKVDRRREAETSEEEAEEEFIDDGQTEASTSEASASQQAPEPEEAPPGPPESEPEDVPVTPARRKRAVALESSPEFEDLPSIGAIANGTQLKQEDIEPMSEPPSTPPGGGAQSAPTYAQTPKSEKRKLMEELAAARSAKKSRRM